ncbi:unnamed protein product [Pleuronectes platessa]|uniref:CCHC-type domain-containing protein n=1 Tax=Pleuronectes platessa TaxID=8262 RepID=A0A9N7YW60_PLEPL|nr:unnamed protein product [Pleuronectes platessa]
MFLESPTNTLEVSFRVKHGDGHYMVYASSGSLKCFECGDVGQKRSSCPHKQRSGEAAGDGSGSAAAAAREETAGPHSTEPAIVFKGSGAAAAPSADTAAALSGSSAAAEPGAEPAAAHSAEVEESAPTASVDAPRAEVAQSTCGRVLSGGDALSGGEDTKPGDRCKGSLSALSGRDGRVEVDWLLEPEASPGRWLAVLVQDAHEKTDSRPPLEGVARGES